MGGQVTLRLMVPEKGRPPWAKAKATQLAWSSRRLPHSWPSASVSTAAGHAPGEELKGSLRITRNCVF